MWSRGGAMVVPARANRSPPQRVGGVGARGPGRGEKRTESRTCVVGAQARWSGGGAAVWPLWKEGGGWLRGWVKCIGPDPWDSGTGRPEWRQCLPTGRTRADVRARESAVAVAAGRGYNGRGPPKGALVPEGSEGAQGVRQWFGGRRIEGRPGIKGCGRGCGRRSAGLPLALPQGEGWDHPVRRRGGCSLLSEGQRKRLPPLRGARHINAGWASRGVGWASAEPNQTLAG